MLERSKATKTAARLAAPSSAQAKGVTNAVSTSLEHNAQSQAVNNRGTLEPSTKSSLMYNPKATQEREKKDTLQAFLMRVRASLQLLGEDTIPKELTLEFLPKIAIHWATFNPLNLATIIPIMTLNGNSMKTIMGRAMGELGKARVLLKDQYTKGYRIDRLAEPEAKQAKAFMKKAETCILNEAGGVICNLATVIDSQADMVVTRSDLITSFANHEVKRIANMYSLEADYLMAIIQTAVLLKGADVQIDAATGNININAAQNINIKANGLVKIEGLLGVEVSSGVNTKIRSALATDISGATISAQASADVKIHGSASVLIGSMGAALVQGSMGCLPWAGVPVPPLRPDLIFPPITTPVVPVPAIGVMTPTTDPRRGDMLPQTSGMLAMPGTVL